MKTHHDYAARLTIDNWTDLLAVQKIDGRSINSLINEGAQLVVRQKTEQMGQHRKDRQSVRTAASWHERR